jgi:hypothetical protein
MHARYQCAISGYMQPDCERPLGARAPQFAAASTPSPRLCQSWIGGGVAAIACDPVVLRSAIRNHLMEKKGKFHLRAAKHRSTDAPGLAQLIGEPLRAGETILAVGRPTSNTFIVMDITVGRHLFRASVKMPELLRVTNGLNVRTKIRVTTRYARPVLRVASRIVTADIVKLR